MKKRPIIIDCDPGHDDALAILWALSSDQLDIKAITTVAGNQTIDKVTQNALQVLTKAKTLGIPVAEGSSEPLFGRRDRVGIGAIVHGDSGLAGPELPEPAFDISETDAVSMIIDILENSDEKITLVPIGPLTNIAKVLMIRSDLKEKIEEISLMGGGTIGNWTPTAEYNIWADAEAAKLVFNSEIPIIMSGLDVTQKAYITIEENEELRKQGNELSIFAAELIDHFIKYHLDIEKFPGCTLHDPCSIAVLLHPEIFEYDQCNVDVETEGELTKGMTVVDRINYQEKIFGKETVKNTKFLHNVDREKFRDLFFEAMRKLG